MVRLIDADSIPWDVEGVGEIPVITKDEIDQLPTVNIPIPVGESVGAVPVRHGKWCEGTECYSDDFIVCSVCGEAFNVMDNDTYRFDYCPSCGARMVEDDQTN